MKYVPALTFIASVVFFGATLRAESVRVEIDLAEPLHAISPLIYGSNHEVDGYLFRDARRLGGNRLTPYNWEIDVSNAGKDFKHQNDRWLTHTDWWKDTTKGEWLGGEGSPANAVINFQGESLSRGAYSLVTVPMAGYVAGDADGPLDESEVAPSPRWVAVQADSGEPEAAFLNDQTVYADQFVNYLVDRFGSANSPQGIGGYSLDNEPALWHKTHPRLHPEQVTCEGLLTKAVATAAAIKAVDPDAEVYGPALWGMTAYATLSKAPDWKQVKQGRGYDWFIDYYLETMQAASQEAGHRLLDVLDVHWYTESPKGREWTGPESVHAAKVMYEPGFVEDNWVGRGFAEFLPLLPRLQQSIDRYFPGTRIAITEYDWPMTDQIYGGLVQADALGAFGRHNVYFASYHHYSWEKPDRYVGSAFSLFRNYDGNQGAFGDNALATQVNGDADVSVYAALDEAAQRIHLIIVAREIKQNTPLELRWAEGKKAVGIEAYTFDAESPEVRRVPDAATLSDGGIDLSIPPLSAWHVVVTLDQH